MLLCQLKADNSFRLLQPEKTNIIRESVTVLQTFAYVIISNRLSPLVESKPVK